MKRFLQWLQRSFGSDSDREFIDGFHRVTLARIDRELIDRHTLLIRALGEENQQRIRDLSDFQLRVFGDPDSPKPRKRKNRK
jgi:hypothetical protein